MSIRCSSYYSTVAAPTSATSSDWQGSNRECAYWVGDNSGRSGDHLTEEKT